MTKVRLLLHIVFSNSTQKDKNMAKLYEMVPTMKLIAESKVNVKGDSPADVAKFMENGAFDARPEQEHLYVLHLDTSGYIKARELITIGNLFSTVAGARETFRAAIAAGSYAIVLIHNHPSGDVTPSPQDIDLTKAMVACGQVTGIPVLDHIVMASDCRSWTSMRNDATLKSIFRIRIKYEGDTALNFDEIDEDE